MPIMDKAEAGNLSTQANRQSVCSMISGSEGTGDKECDQVRRVVEKTICTKTTHEQAPASTSSGQSSGRYSDEYLQTHVMEVIRDLDGKHSLHFHVETKYLEAIAEGKYIDFSKLLKDEHDDDDDNIEVKMQNALTFYLPASKPCRKIDCVETWLKAFVVFDSAFNLYHPNKAATLLEYRTSIERFAADFDWVNVYAYDRHFRQVQANKPGRPWNLVNQDAKDQHLIRGCKGVEKKPGFNGNGQKPVNKGDKKKRCELCHRWNSKGQCRFGDNCRFDHRCTICGKPGHGAISCGRRREAEKGHKKDPA